MDFGRSIPPYSKEKGRQRASCRRRGRSCPQVADWLSLPGNQDSLVDTYARAAVVINPVKFGTGLPGKNN